MIIPSNSSYRKYIKVVLGIFLLYIIISPILSNNLENINFEKTFAVENIPEITKANSIDYEKQITEAYKTNLKENMIVTDEPGIYIPGKFGIRIEDTILVEKNGCTVLTKSPKNYVII